MGGLLILFLLGLYLWIAYKVVRRVPPVWGKVLAIVVVVLIPTADAIYGRIKLKQMCAVEGGIKVQKTIENVDGVFTVGLLAPALVMDMNYEFSENIISEQIYRYRRPTGKLSAYTHPSKEKVDKKLSLYSYYREEIYIDSSILKTTDFVRLDSTSEILGANTDFHYYGGWLERFIGKLYGSGSTRVNHCSSDEDSARALKILAATLKVKTTFQGENNK